MSIDFLKLPSELRNKIYELCLVQQHPINPLITEIQRQKLTPGLFRANKTIHREASSLFYAKNCFDFTLLVPADVHYFLGMIGDKNASYIRRIYIDFPQFFFLELGNVVFDMESDSILTDIENSCTNLRTLKISLCSTCLREKQFSRLKNPNIVAEALRLVDTRFKSISSSLQDIILEVCEDGVDDRVRNEIENLAWKLEKTPNYETLVEWELSSDSEDYLEHDHGSGESGDDSEHDHGSAEPGDDLEHDHGFDDSDDYSEHEIDSHDSDYSEYADDDADDEHDMD